MIICVRMYVYVCCYSYMRIEIDSFDSRTHKQKRAIRNDDQVKL